MLRIDANRSRALLSSLAMLAVCVLPLSAQSQVGEGRAEPMRHAEIGRLVGTDPDITITTEFPTEGTAGQVHRKFRTGPTTLVEGLGGIMEAREIPADVQGRIVIVEFEANGGANQPPMADRLQFPIARTIRVTRGSIVGMDMKAHRMTIKNEQGEQQMLLDIGHGVTIDDLQEGIVGVDDLQVGQNVVVYFDQPSGLGHGRDDAGIAYLITR